MKNMDAMILAVLACARGGRRPDVVLTFLADEEAGGVWGAGYLAKEHLGLFEGVTEAIGEVGGFSATIGGQRVYLLQTAEKGIAWLRLSLRGPAGHGSIKASRNVVAELAETVARINRYEWRCGSPAAGVPGGRRRGAGIDPGADARGCWRSWARSPG